MKYITRGTDPVITYQQKVVGAQASKASFNPKPEDYPIQVYEIGITAPKLAEVPDTVLAAYHQS